MPGKDRTRANVRTTARGPMPDKGQAIKDQMSSGQPTGRRRARPNGLPNAPRPGQHSGRKHRHISIGTVLRVRPAIVRSTASATFSGPGRNRPARNGAAVAAPPAVAAAAGGKRSRILVAEDEVPITGAVPDVIRDLIGLVSGGPGSEAGTAEQGNTPLHRNSHSFESAGGSNMSRNACQ
jgi:hypothetical protein